jgi:hypothetical protein
MKTNCNTPPVFSLSLSLTHTHTHTNTITQCAPLPAPRKSEQAEKKKETIGPGAKFKQPIQNNKGWVCHTNYSLAIYI